MDLEKFVDELPIMNRTIPITSNKDYTYYEVQMQEFTKKLHRDLPPTRLWGYNGQYPGPTFYVQRNERVRVHWINHLPRTHFLPTNQPKHPIESEPEVRTVVHLHGMSAHSKNIVASHKKQTQSLKPFLERKVHEYQNEQKGATLWYHDYDMEMNRYNVYAGLSGLYIIEDSREQSLQLPAGPYDIPLLIQDRTFNDDGSLFFPDHSNSSVAPFEGDTILVNGKVWPYLEVEPRKYRFRILNGSTHRAYTLYLDTNQTIYQIASDGGLLKHTTPLKELQINPGERIEVIIDFTNFEGLMITLKNHLKSNKTPTEPITDIMQFKVVIPINGEDSSRIPFYLSEIPSLRNTNIQSIRHLKFNESTHQDSRPILLSNNRISHNPVHKTPQTKRTEIWSFINTTNITHLIHAHFVQFQVLTYQPFDLIHYKETGEMNFTASTLLPNENYRGLKDTLSIPEATVTRIIAHFSPHSKLFVWRTHY
ncbi:multicopper oxidase family protein [Alkalihalobacillus trypoxylicola]|uniref:Copper oxidase n=1 Tax=Alkalihalobacillus trypoxylicola TaxID=519424 RepID=A0A162EJ56_9BACI|nr:multicopper oxidase domain-containing protein [Alkalihalobacillus trypoxylicola]KYG33034.1 hypothetical protein AZF04_17915 [Alkalihalobacillus trypoxylicola]